MMMRKLITALVFVLFSCSLQAQFITLPTIDDPQDVDLLTTYTRGFAAAFRLDTLKRYFQENGLIISDIFLTNSGTVLNFEMTNGTTIQIPGATGPQGPQGDPGADGADGAQGIQGPQGDPATADGNGIYDASGTVPTGTVAQSKRFPSDPTNAVKLRFADLSSSNYYSGIETTDNASGDGFRLISRVNSSGTTIASSLGLEIGNEFTTIAHRTWYWNNNTSGLYRGIDWGRTKPGLRVGTSSFVDMPDVLPSASGQVWTVNSTGFGQWQTLSTGSTGPEREVRTTTLSRSSTSILTDTDLRHSGVAAGLYRFKAVLRFTGTNTSTDLRYRLDRTFTLNDCSFTRSDDTGLVSIEGFTYTADLTSTVDDHIIILEGTFYNGVSNNTVEIEWGASNTSGTVRMIRGSFLEIESL